MLGIFKELYAIGSHIQLVVAELTGDFAINIARIGGLELGGNLFAGNRYQDYAFALPKESQKVTTPAASSLYLLVKAPTAVNEVTAEKEIVSVQYVNTSGMSSNQPFEGVNIVITKYADGTTSTTKVIK